MEVTDELTEVLHVNVGTLIQAMIERHCEWLNRHTTEWDKEYDGPTREGSEHRYNSTQFHALTNEYGYRKVLATTLVGSSRLVIHCEIHDGDEGGPSVLTGFHDEETIAFYRHRPTGEEVTSPDWTRPLDLSYDHTEHAGWRLNDLMLEFDTMRSHTLRDGQLINCPDAPDSSALEDGDLVEGL